jgi:hypothetical protein
MSDALHSHPDRRDAACMTSIGLLRLVAERGIPFSHTCSRLQCFARRDYLKIGGRDPLPAEFHLERTPNVSKCDFRYEEGM